MSFINSQEVQIAGPLKAAHYELSRATALRDAFSRCVTDYYTKASSGKDFEANGLLVTGKSRVGKTRELKHLITEFNEANEKMPDGRPARIVPCLLSGKVTWKDLGKRAAAALDYSIDSKYRDQNYIWEKVIDQARRHGIIGIHFDECQHVFSNGGEKTNPILLDSFKTLLKDSRWPLMLILSGVPVLSSFVQREEQLARLLRPVTFELIDPERDINELMGIAYSYADLAGICFDPLSSIDFFRRLSFACTERWGLVIEMIIDALTTCRMQGENEISIDHFSTAYSRIYGTPPGYSPFTVDDYREHFDQAKILALLDEA